jgi:hypothetical protein
MQLTALRMSVGALVADSEARCSQALSMMLWALAWVMFLSSSVGSFQMD